MIRILILILCLLGFYPLRLCEANAQAAPPSVLVTSVPLKKGSLPRSITAYGRVVADSAASQAIMAPLPAIVDQIYIRQGEIVDQGSPLVRLSPGPQIIAAYDKARVAATAAKQLVRRTKRLLEQHLATQQQLIDAQKVFSDAQSELGAEEALGASGPHVLSAPFKAIVTSINSTAGAIVAAGSPLMALAHPNGLLLKVEVVPADAVFIERGDPVKIIPLGSSDPVLGKVILRSAMINSTDGMVSTEIAVSAGKVLLGEMASAQIKTGEVSGYLVPHDALLIDNKGHNYVMQNENGRAKKVVVHVLNSEFGRDVVEGKLIFNAPVILSGAHQLKDGMKIRYSITSKKAEHEKTAQELIQ